VENERLKRRVVQLEQSLKQSVMLGGTDAPKSRQEQEELLLKAKTLLFEKTKVNKQQEQQIAVLKTQVETVKDVLQVTKDMLQLKTAECEHTQARLEKSQLWIKAEQDKCLLTEKKLLISKGVYDKLRSEYDTQSRISHSPARSLPALLCTRSLSRNNKPNSSSLVCASAYSEVQFIIH